MKDTDGKLMEMEMDTSEPVVLSFQKKSRHTRAIGKMSCQSKVPGTICQEKRLPVPAGSSPTSSGEAKALLRQHGDAFVKKFLEAHPGAIPLASKEPGVCWGSAGVIHFAAVDEDIGPTTTQMDAPLLLRIRTNLCPPETLPYHMNLATFRQKLGVPASAVIAVAPMLEIFAAPDEVGVFGSWVPAWHDAYLREGVPVPPPPIALLSWNGLDKPKNLMSAGRRWRDWFVLRTHRAYQLLDSWLKNPG